MLCGVSGYSRSWGAENRAVSVRRCCESIGFTGTLEFEGSVGVPGSNDFSVATNASIKASGLLVRLLGVAVISSGLPVKNTPIFGVRNLDPADRIGRRRTKGSLAGTLSYRIQTVGTA